LDKFRDFFLAKTLVAIDQFSIMTNLETNLESILIINYF